MKILRTFINTGKAIIPVDTVEYQGALWLVAEWKPLPSEGMFQPIRIIRPLKQTFQKVPRGVPADYRLGKPIPRVVFSGQIPTGKEDEYEVVEAPLIQIRKVH